MNSQKLEVQNIQASHLSDDVLDAVTGGFEASGVLAAFLNGLLSTSGSAGAQYVLEGLTGGHPHR